MGRLFAFAGGTLGSWLGGALATRLGGGIMSLYMVSVVGGAAGVYYGRRIAASLLD